MLSSTSYKKTRTAEGTICIILEGRQSELDLVSMSMTHWPLQSSLLRKGNCPAQTPDGEEPTMRKGSYSEELVRIVVATTAMLEASRRKIDLSKTAF